MFENIRSALASIWSNKLRSLLTLLGVVIGVSSVTTLVALGQGLKHDVSNLIEGFGTNVVVVLPGKIDPKNTSAQSNPANFINGDVLTNADVQSIAKVNQVTDVSPMSPVTGTLKYAGREATPLILGTYPSILSAFQVVGLDKGSMFTSNDAGPVLVIGAGVATSLFADANPIGQKIRLGQTEFTVIGVLGAPKPSSFSNEFDSIAFMPFNQAKLMNKDQVKIIRIVAKAADGADVNKVKSDIHSAILNNHQGEENFTVLTQDDILSLFDQFLNLATAMVSAIAAISLIVGGIGIMNIMLVTVTERTREIGLRKAVGATKGAIALQFLTEAVVVTLVGGLLGLGLAFAGGRLIAVKSPLQPVFSWQVLLITVGISLVIGVIFGIWPALRAANKDPIEALRYE